MAVQISGSSGCFHFWYYSGFQTHLTATGRQHLHHLSITKPAAFLKDVNVKLAWKCQRKGALAHLHHLFFPVQDEDLHCSSQNEFFDSKLLTQVEVLTQQ